MSEPDFFADADLPEASPRRRRPTFEMVHTIDWDMVLRDSAIIAAAAGNLGWLWTGDWRWAVSGLVVLVVLASIHVRTTTHYRHAKGAQVAQTPKLSSNFDPPTASLNPKRNRPPGGGGVGGGRGLVSTRSLAELPVLPKGPAPGSTPTRKRPPGGAGEAKASGLVSSGNTEGGLESLGAPPPRSVRQIQAQTGGGADPHDIDD